jgi:hypothetical protein
MSKPWRPADGLPLLDRAKQVGMHGMSSGRVQYEYHQQRCKHHDMKTSHGGLDGKSGMLAWHCQSISTALLQQRHSIARALRTLKPQRQPVYKQAIPSCGLAPLLGRA